MNKTKDETLPPPEAEAEVVLPLEISAEQKTKYWDKLDEVSKEIFKENFNREEVLQLFKDWLFINEDSEITIDDHLTNAAEHLGNDLDEFIIRALQAYLNVYYADDHSLSDDLRLAMIKEIANYEE